jgi:hypothetical protein
MRDDLIPRRFNELLFLSRRATAQEARPQLHPQADRLKNEVIRKASGFRHSSIGDAVRLLEFPIPGVLTARTVNGW